MRGRSVPCLRYTRRRDATRRYDVCFRKFARAPWLCIRASSWGQCHQILHTRLLFARGPAVSFAFEILRTRIFALRSLSIFPVAKQQNSLPSLHVLRLRDGKEARISSRREEKGTRVVKKKYPLSSDLLFIVDFDNS